MKKSLVIAAVALVVAAASCAKAPGFITRDGSQFIRDGKPYYYVGANYWCGPVLASPGVGGNRDRLMHDLDALQAAGVENLRVLVGADENGQNNRSIIPYLQSEPGVLNEDLLTGLDYFMAELGKRGMTATLYFNNHCPWSGGYTYYVKKVTGEEPPSYWGPDYREFASRFISMREPQELFLSYVKTMVSRTNSVTGVAYKDDPAIFAWQIANEPRAFYDELHPQFIALMHETAELIRSIDPNHMISTGMEGQQGCETLIDEYETVHADPLIDYTTFHIWPDNWGFADLYGDSMSQLQNHIDVAERIGKPLVIEEFGLYRDNKSYDPASSTSHRDEYYKWVFDKVVASAAEGGVIAGANFWAFAGAGRPRADVWEDGDDLLGDPPFEPQGMFSVFDCDSTTLAIVKGANDEIRTVTASAAPRK